MGKGIGAQARYDAIRDAVSRKVRRCDTPQDENGRPLRVSEYFGSNTFDRKKLQEKLPRDTYSKLIETIESGKKLDRQIADSVAHAAKEWALEEGATHFCHWFHPQTGATAEKHDAFLTIDSKKESVERFSGAQLIQSEPDASSFPSGGMRTTFEARGYTAWDPSSPMFILETENGKTLCIPSAFISYYGDALDEKTGLLRSMQGLSDKACELLSLIGDKNVSRVVPTLGLEQEYFLLDRAYYGLRSDIVMSGRTLVGAQPARGQQLDDHYFGSIPSRALAFMNEVEQELYKLGVPTKTRHNEVAPSQFETAPIFEEANVATDHNQIVMETLRKVARRHEFRVLLHEKPFAELNGSGKHSNWSMQDNQGNNLLDPGKTPQQNLRFLLFLVGVLRGVHKHSGLIRAGIASAGNDHRLGANEVPPAIISVFLGQTLDAILDKIEKGTELKNHAEDAMLQLGVGQLPAISKDNTDRNRTSPFAFTGNKFELRAVGGEASPAFPCTVLNAAVADGLTELNAELKKKVAAKVPLDTAMLETIQVFAKKTRAIRFEGNNYSDDWVKEAEGRGLPHLRKTPESLEQLLDPKSKKLLTDFEIFTNEEIESRFNVRIENYIKKLLIEVESFKGIVDSQILPASYQYHTDLAAGVATAKAAGTIAPQTETLNKVGKMLMDLNAKRSHLDGLLTKMGGLSKEIDQAKLLSKEVNEAMEDARSVCDQLEGVVSDEYWPLPKYGEMLFLS